MFNKCVFVGRITFNLNLHKSGDVSFVSNTLAVKRPFGKDAETDFIPFKVWNKSAEYLCNYAKKGDLILICGSLKVDKYTDKEGQNKTTYYINCETANILQSKPQKEEEQKENINYSPEEDLPF